MIFTAGTHFHMDDEIDSDIMSKLKTMIFSSAEGPEGWAIVPYAITGKLHRWAKPLVQLGVKLIGELDWWMDKYASKGILHRHIKTPEVPSVLEDMGVGQVRGWCQWCSALAVSQHEAVLRSER